ncbi:MAG: signal peptidase I [Spirochaetaceae bacterium]|jgi:signal peptidase I|nr:signal peptidase I [Spirochaetaceae bacterium]
MAARTDFFDRLQELTEAWLTRGKRNRRIKKEKLRGKNPVIDWIEAFLWAAGVVLLINQYLFQAYQIPSGSMIDTLMIKDRIFVNKVIYGPELLPGTAKLPSPIRPKRNDIIIFENPSYISRGPVFDIAQRIIYMLTLSLVDLDRDETGEPKAHFLIKRAVGMGGDRFISERGELLIRFPGEDRWISERDYAASRNMNHRLSRLMEAGNYPALEAAGRAAAYAGLGLTPPPYLLAASRGADNVSYADTLAYAESRLAVLRAANPHEDRYGMILSRYTLGWYVPENRIFPLGDNRDNSRDGRYFGPVRESKVLGRGSVIYWPLGRFGPIR